MVLQQAPESIFSPAMYGIFAGLGLGVASTFLSRILGLLVLGALLIIWLRNDTVLPDWIEDVAGFIALGALGGAVLSLLKDP